MLPAVRQEALTQSAVQELLIAGLRDRGLALEPFLRANNMVDCNGMTTGSASAALPDSSYGIQCFLDKYKVWASNTDKQRREERSSDDESSSSCSEQNKQQETIDVQEGNAAGARAPHEDSTGSTGQPAREPAQQAGSTRLLGAEQTWSAALQKDYHDLRRQNKIMKQALD